MLSPNWDTVRLSLHVIAATIWVGGQFTLAGLVPTLRAHDAELPKKVARRFNRLAWPAYGVLVATGIWSVLRHDMASQTNAYNLTVFLKLVIVGVAGFAAVVHSNTRSKVVLAVGGALSWLASLGAVFVGILLTSAH